MNGSGSIDISSSERSIRTAPPSARGPPSLLLRGSRRKSFYSRRAAGFCDDLFVGTDPGWVPQHANPATALHEEVRQEDRTRGRPAEHVLCPMIRRLFVMSMMSNRSG